MATAEEARKLEIVVTSIQEMKDGQQELNSTLRDLTQAIVNNMDKGAPKVQAKVSAEDAFLGKLEGFMDNMQKLAEESLEGTPKKKKEKSTPNVSALYVSQSPATSMVIGKMIDPGDNPGAHAVVTGISHSTLDGFWRGAMGRGGEKAFDWALRRLGW